jgi:hypothetical protein
MRIRRNIASVPLRSAKETWRAIMDLVTACDSVDKHQLDAAASVMESLIADELPESVPIVFKGSGPRVLIYCLYSEKAMEAGLAIDALTMNPTTGDWRVTAPCEDEDVEWMNKTLKARAPRLTVHAADEAPSDASADSERQGTKGMEIDWGALSTR